MADKQATVRITADPKGLVQGIRAGETQAKQSAKGIESSLKTAADNAGKAMRDSTGRFIKQGAEEGARGALSAMRDMESQSRGIFARMANAFKQAMGGAARAIGGVGRDFLRGVTGGDKTGVAEALGGKAAGGAQAALAVAGKAVVDANAVLEKATRLSISSRGAGTAGVDPSALVGEFFAITQDIKGVTADQLADGAARFVQMTGDLATARSSLRDFATIAMASGASVEDVAGTAAAISQQFGITDPTQLRDTLASLTFQGKSGAFELRDAASLFPRLAAAGSSFGLDKGAGGVKTLGGLSQIAMSATGSGERAATAVTALLSKLTTESGKLAARGAGDRVDVFDKSGKARDLPTVLAELIGRTGGNDMAKKKAGLVNTLDREAYAGVAGLVGEYGDMLGKAKGKNEQERQADAMRMLRERIESSINAAGDFTEAQRDAAMASSTFSSQMTASWERVTGGVADKVLPRLLGFGERLSKMDGVIDAFVGGLGLVVSALEQFNDVINAITGANQNNKFRSQYVNEAARERQRAEGMRAELAGMQMRPEAIAAMEQADPAELQRRREKARGLRERIDLAEATANLWDRKATDLKPSIGMSAEERAAAGRRAAGLEDVPMQGGAGRPVVKAELPDKEMRVRVTNPKDIGAQQGAPAPGWTPPRG